MKHYPEVVYGSKLAGLFGLVAIFWAWHGQWAFVLPNMACEDGQVMWAYYLSQPSPWGIFRFYYGYISLLPNLVGYLSAQVPPTWSPYVLAYFALAVKAAAHTIFALRRFRGVIASDNLRWWIALWLGLLPLGDVLLFDNTTYSIWNLLWIVLLLAYAPLGASWVGQVAQFGLMALCIGSHPLTLVIMPLLLYNLVTRPADRWFNGGLVVVLLLYLGLGVEIGFSERPRSLLLSVWVTPLYLLNRVVFEALLGYHLRLLLYQAGQLWLIYLPALLVVAGLAWWYGRRWRQLSWPTHWQIGLVAYGIGALTWLTLYTRAADATIYMGEWNLRYFYVQQMLLWLGLAVAVGRMWQPQPHPNPPPSTSSGMGEGTVNRGGSLFSNRYEGADMVGTAKVQRPSEVLLPHPSPNPSTSSGVGEGIVNRGDVLFSHRDGRNQAPFEKTVPPLTRGRVGGGVVLFLAAYLAVTHYYHWNYLRTWPEDGRRLAEFLQTVEAYQRSGPHTEQREFFLKRDCFDIQFKL